jgi:hypothetical protein
MKHRSWRRFRALALVMAMLTLGLAAGSTPVYAIDGLPIAFGAYAQPQGGQSLQQAVIQLETQIGRPLETVRVFETWTEAFPDSYHNFLKNGDRTLILSVKPTRNGSRIQWASLANAAPGSQLDNEMRSWARRIRDFEAPIYVTLHHEPESSSGAGTATDFIAAWRRWVDIFREEGASNVRFMWIMTDYAFHVPQSDRRYAPKWYPGDQWTDAMGIDAYNWHVCRPNADNPWKTLATIVEPFRSFGVQHPSVDLWLTEWATWEDPNVANRKAGWIDQARALFKTPQYSQFAGVLYFHSRAINPNFDDCVWRVDTSTSALASFRAMANDPFYMGDAFGGPPDTEAPTAPGKPAVRSEAPGEVTLDWQASTDDQATNLLYSIYRDQGTMPVGTISSSSTGIVSFTDSGVPSGTYTYSISAGDGTNESARSPDSDPITVEGPAGIFADDFSAGFTNWSGSTGLSIDNGQGGLAPPSARAQTNASPAWAFRTLGTSVSSACMSMNVNVSSIGSPYVALLRLRTAANGNIVRVFMTGAGVLWVKSDVSGQQISSSTAIGSGWHQVELCGGSGTWSLYRDGIPIVTNWSANTGTAPIGRIEIGDTLGRTFTINFDDVVVDQVPG